MPGRIEPTNAMAILGILAEEPRSGYDLLRTIRERGAGLLDVPAGCVQYHPEAGPGPNDSLNLFDEFIGAFSAA